MSYGEVRCGFQKSGILRLRFGAVFRHCKSYGAVRCCDISYGAIRRGSPLNGFFYGAAPLSVGKIVQHRFFSTVRPMNKPYQAAVSYGSRAFTRCTVLINRTNPRVRKVFCRFFISRQSRQQQQVLGALRNRFNKSIRTYVSSVINKSFPQGERCVP